MKTSKITEWKILGNGSYGPRSLEAGTPAVGKVDPIMQFCSVMGIRGLVRLIFGKKDELRRIKGNGQY